MKLTILPDGTFKYEQPTLEEMASPTISQDIFKLCEASPELNLNRRRWTAQGICDNCVAWAMHKLLKHDIMASAMTTLQCTSRKPTGLESVGIQKLDWTRPHGPYSKECIVTVDTDTLASAGCKPEDLWWLIDNLSQHRYIQLPYLPYKTIDPDGGLCTSKCPLGGSVTGVDRELGIYQATIYID